MSSWIIGVGMSVAGSVASNIGINVQKYSQNKNRKLAKTKRKMYYCQPLWHIGLLLVFSGSVMDFFALSYAAQSIIAPIGSVALVANMVFARVFLKEQLSKLDFFATMLIIAGAVTAVMFGDHADHVQTVESLKFLFSQPPFLLYAGITGYIALNVYAYLRYLSPMRRKLDQVVDQFCAAVQKTPQTDTSEYGSSVNGMTPQDYIQLPPTSVTAPEINAELIEAISKYKTHSKVHPFLYCCLSGLLGAQSVLCAKSIAELFRETVFGGEMQFTHWLPIVLIILILVFIFSQLHFLALGLQHFDALYVVPVFQCFFILCSTIGGAAFFQEFSQFTLIQFIMFPLGASVTLFGVFLLSRHKMSTPSPEHLLPRFFSTSEFLPLYWEAQNMGKEARTAQQMQKRLDLKSVNVVSDIQYLKSDPLGDRLALV